MMLLILLLVNDGPDHVRVALLQGPDDVGGVECKSLGSKMQPILLVDVSPGLGRGSSQA